MWVFFGLKGPYECGKWNYISIFINGLIHYLEEGERVEEDKGYVVEYPQTSKTLKGFVRDERSIKISSKVLERHETVNK